MHTFAPFLVERAYEQIKLGFGHQDTDGVLVSTGGSVDMPTAGRTHQTGADVMLMSAVPGFEIHVPGTAVEVDQMLRRAHRTRGRHYVRVTAQQNSLSFDILDTRMHRVRTGASNLVVVAVGPTLDAVLDATIDLDATVCYSPTVRPFDAAGLRDAVGNATGDVVLVEPYLRGTSAHEVTSALSDRAHRLLSVGFGVDEMRHYGTTAQHLCAAGLDAAGIAATIRSWREPVAA